MTIVWKKSQSKSVCSLSKLGCNSWHLQFCWSLVDSNDKCLVLKKSHTKPQNHTWESDLGVTGMKEIVIPHHDRMSCRCGWHCQIKESPAATSTWVVFSFSAQLYLQGLFHDLTQTKTSTRQWIKLDMFHIWNIHEHSPSTDHFPKAKEWMGSLSFQACGTSSSWWQICGAGDRRNPVTFECSRHCGDRFWWLLGWPRNGADIGSLFNCIQ